MPSSPEQIRRERQRKKNKGWKSTKGPKGTPLPNVFPKDRGPQEGGMRGISARIQAARKKPATTTTKNAAAKPKSQANPLAVGLPEPTPVGTPADTTTQASGLPPNIMPTGTGVVGLNITGSLPSGGKVPAVETSLKVNDKNIFARAKNAAGIEYDPQIDAIKSLISSTDKKGQAGISDTGSAYDALSRATAAGVGGVNKRYDDAQAAIAAMTAKLSGGIDQRYNDTASRSAEEFQRLGIQDATPTVQKGMTSDRDFLAELSKLQGAGTNNVLEMQQQGAVNLQQNSAMRTGMEGANRTADMRNSLAEKLLQLNQQQGSMVGTKAKAIRELSEKYRDEQIAQAERDRAFKLDAQQFQESTRQNNISNSMRNREFNWGMETDKANMAMKAAEMNAPAPVDIKSLDPAERAAYKYEQLQPGHGERAIAFLQKVINSDVNIRRGYYSKMDKNTGKEIKSPMTPERFGHIVRNRSKGTKLDPGSIQKIAALYWKEMNNG